MLLEADEQVRKQPDPDLPLDGVLVVAHEVVELKRLLQLLEKELYRPSRPVQLGDGARAPGEVVCDEAHHDVLAVHLDDGRDAAQEPGVFFTGVASGHAHGLVCYYAWVFVPPAFNHVENHVVLIPEHEEDAALLQPVEKSQIEVGSVGQQDVAVLEPRAKRVGAFGIVVRRVLDDGERRQHGADVEAHVRLGGGFLTSMPRPVYAGEAELQRCRVDGEYVPFHAEEEPLVLAVLRESGTDLLQVLEYLPVEVFCYFGISCAVGV